MPDIVASSWSCEQCVQVEDNMSTSLLNHASSRPSRVEAPEPDATCCLVGPSDLVASRPPVDLGVLGYGSILANLRHLVCRPVLPHDIDVGVARDFLGQPPADLLCLH